MISASTVSYAIGNDRTSIIITDADADADADGDGDAVDIPYSSSSASAMCEGDAYFVNDGKADMGKYHYEKQE